ncbi:hypothetical protein [Flavobacterium selenitireducens]|uniref:hypothetical protein n=1 Tax=Flavobacterium selenitireducens TaxID=2722704 RepID=UPI00168B19BF|nr:hypothetical protein [Flavobacterium selenitireducens]MBD3581326.1 hypothetical protein [Flavobacterium selenitireducens]
MTNKKIYAVVAVPLVVAFLFWLFTEAFNLISAPSDTSLLIGILLASAGLFILLKLIQFLLKTFLR